MPIAIEDLKFKKIKDYSDDELKFAITHSVTYLKEKQIDFYTILRGIDAYFEQRNRKNSTTSK